MNAKKLVIINQQKYLEILLNESGEGRWKWDFLNSLEL
jgi:hypothetical protein